MDFEIESDGSDGDFQWNKGPSNKKKSSTFFGNDEEVTDEYMYDFNYEDKKKKKSKDPISAFSPSQTELKKLNKPDNNIITSKPNPPPTSGMSALEKAQSMLQKYSGKVATAPKSNFKNPKPKTFDEDDISLSTEADSTGGDEMMDSSNSNDDFNMVVDKNMGGKMSRDKAKKKSMNQKGDINALDSKATVMVSLGDKPKLTTMSDTKGFNRGISKSTTVFSTNDIEVEDNNGVDPYEILNSSPLLLERKNDDDDDDYSDEDFDKLEESAKEDISNEKSDVEDVKTKKTVTYDDEEDEGFNRNSMNLSRENTSFSRINYGDESDIDEDEIIETMEESQSKPKILSFSDFASQPDWESSVTVKRSEVQDNFPLQHEENVEELAESINMSSSVVEDNLSHSFVPSPTENQNPLKTNDKQNTGESRGLKRSEAKPLLETIKPSENPVIPKEYNISPLVSSVTGLPPRSHSPSLTQSSQNNPSNDTLKPSTHSKPTPLPNETAVAQPVGSYPPGPITFRPQPAEISVGETRPSTQPITNQYPTNTAPQNSNPSSQNPVSQNPNPSMVHQNPASSQGYPYPYPPPPPQGVAGGPNSYYPQYPSQFPPYPPYQSYPPPQGFPPYQNYTGSQNPAEGGGTAAWGVPPFYGVSPPGYMGWGYPPGVGFPPPVDPGMVERLLMAQAIANRGSGAGLNPALLLSMSNTGGGLSSLYGSGNNPLSSSMAAFDVNRSSIFSVQGQQQVPVQPPLVMELLEELKKSKEEADWAKHKLAETIIRSRDIKNEYHKIHEEAELRNSREKGATGYSKSKPSDRVNRPPLSPLTNGSPRVKGKSADLVSTGSVSEEMVDDDLDSTKYSYDEDFEDSELSISVGGNHRNKSGVNKGFNRYNTENTITSIMEEESDEGGSDYSSDFEASSIQRGLKKSPGKRSPISPNFLKNPNKPSSPTTETKENITGKENNKDEIEPKLTLQNPNLTQSIEGKGGLPPRRSANPVHRGSLNSISESNSSALIDPLKASIANSLMASQEMFRSQIESLRTRLHSSNSYQFRYSQNPDINPTQPNNPLHSSLRSSTGSSTSSLKQIKKQFERKRVKDTEKMFDVLMQIYPDLDVEEAKALVQKF